MIKYIQKDITTVESPAIIIHGVNCQRAMGSGVAKALFTKWPQVREDYMEISKEVQAGLLGEVQPVKVANALTVFNCFTQQFYGHSGEVYADPNAIRLTLSKVAEFSHKYGRLDVYSPRIGCGLGGLDWDRDVFPQFKTVFIMQQPGINVYICDL